MEIGGRNLRAPGQAAIQLMEQLTRVRIRDLLIAGAALHLIASACAHTPAAAPAAGRHTVLQRQSGFLAALSARDADRAASYFGDDAVLHVAERPAIRGRAAIREFYGNVFRFLSSSSATPEHASVSESADMAYTTGTVVNTFAGQQGQMQFTGKYLLVWERRAGEWFIVAYTLSSDSRQ